MTLEELRSIPLQYTFGYSADTHAVRQYMSEDKLICKQVYTPRDPETGMWGNGEVAYMLVPTKQEFETIAELLEAINAREAA
jgi:hypothetical protein